MTEPTRTRSATPTRGQIGKAIRLPLSKAVEISLKSLRVRFWRSMLTVSSIILAIAFLTFVWTSSRVQSAVAIGMRPDAARAAEVGQALSDAWKPFESELTRRFKNRKGDFNAELKKLYDGGTRSFKTFCRNVASEPQVERRVDLKDLPYDPAVVETLAAKARGIGLLPDLDGWCEPSLRLAGVKGVVQGEVSRYNNLQLALQRRGLQPGMAVDVLARMSPTVIWLIVISLLVCGVGISNAMLMSVTERFREIGTMKCLGALDGFIVKLFLLESTFQGVAGTVFGVLIGFVFMLLAGLKSFGLATFHYFPTLQVLLIIVYAFAVGGILSILAAVFPALRAAHMAPVEAMRVEE